MTAPELAAPPLPVRWLGRVAYRAALELQERHRDRLLGGDGSAECLLLLEHDPVITLGRSGDATSVLVSPDELARRRVDLVRATRGGDVTYHGPGQLIVYPVVRLATGVVAYLEALAAALAVTAAELGVPGAAWRRSPAGLWLGDAKLAACGLNVRRGVAVHGFALDVATPREAWSLIHPCGQPGARNTSIAAERARRGAGPPPSIEAVAAAAAPHVVRALGRAPTIPST
jgi:lipoate-protein ligase B